MIEQSISVIAQKQFFRKISLASGSSSGRTSQILFFLRLIEINAHTTEAPADTIYGSRATNKNIHESICKKKDTPKRG